MHTTCMSSKTISLREEAYERLRAARRYPGESFSAVVLRAAWPETTTTGKAFLDLWIAATAVAHGVPVVTRNTRHYRRVPGLDVRGYSTDG